MYGQVILPRRVVTTASVSLLIVTGCTDVVDVQSLDSLLGVLLKLSNGDCEKLLSRFSLVDSLAWHVQLWESSHPL